MDSALLQQIQKGKGLKKAVTNDRSQPAVAGPAVPRAPSPPPAPSPARAPPPPPAGPPGRAPPPPVGMGRSRANGSTASAGFSTPSVAPPTPNVGASLSRIPSPPAVLALPNAPTRTFPPSAQFPPPRPFDAGQVMGRKKLAGWDYKAHMG
ncbi:hypothetical protein JCM3770_002921 [Rhodotorula araucariae]